MVGMFGASEKVVAAQGQPAGQGLVCLLEACPAIGAALHDCDDKSSPG